MSCVAHLRRVRVRPLIVALALASSAAFATAPDNEWRSYNGGAGQHHYSPLEQINRGNVSQLAEAWSFDTGDAFPGAELECNPLIVDGVLYATTAKLNVIALDAATGELKWRFDPLNGGKVIGRLRNRGLTYWASGSDRRIFIAARQYLYALDARSGRLIETFGSQGHIDMRQGLGRDPSTLAVSLSTPGIVFKDLLIVGSVVPEMLPSAPGDIRAFDARSGALRWTFHTIPYPGEPGYETWPADAWKFAGGANSWGGFALDEKRGILFAPTGSAAFDYYGANRVGDNLYADTLLALDAASGRKLWHFQFVRHDIWDRDLPAPPTLVIVKHGGRLVDAVSQTTKSGHIFVFDRVTGESLFPLEEVHPPTSDVPGEQTATTQRLPVKPDAFARQRVTEDLITTRTPEAHAAVLELFRSVRSNGQFVPGSREGTIVFPGIDGGGEWGGAAFDPKSHVLFVNANEMAWILKLVERPTGEAASGKAIYLAECAACHGPDRAGRPPEFPSLIGLNGRYAETELYTLIGGGGQRMPGFGRLGWAKLLAVTDYVLTGRDSEVAPSNDAATDLPAPSRYMMDGFIKLLDPQGYPGIKPPWGTLSAVDLDTGRYLWRVPLGNYPELVQQGVTDTGSENYGGPVVTASGLVFIGATVRDRTLRAFDARDGSILWQAALPSAATATPAIYEARGREFVVVAVSAGKEPNAAPHASYRAFALPATQKED